MYIDTHAHLNFKAFDHDWVQTIERAKNANVGAIINVGSNYKTSLKAIEIAQNNPNVYAAIGLHPIHTSNEKLDEEKFLKLAQNKKVIAIGETGLDYYYDRSSAEIQKEVFQKFIKMAASISRPLIIHCRQAGDDLLSILMAERPEPAGVMHCFQEDWNFAKVILDMGLYISFTGIITFTKNEKVFEVIKKAPLEKIMIETDSPYLTPEAYSGKRNEPAYVVAVAQKIAQLRKIPLSEVAKATTQNAIELFRL